MADAPEETPEREISDTELNLISLMSKGAYVGQIKEVKKKIAESSAQLQKIYTFSFTELGILPSVTNSISNSVSSYDSHSIASKERYLIGTYIEDLSSHMVDQFNIDHLYAVKLYSSKMAVGIDNNFNPDDLKSNEGCRVCTGNMSRVIHKCLPRSLDASVTMMQVEDKPDVTFQDIGGSKEQIEMIREVVETPLLHPEYFEELGIDPPAGVLLYGPPGTGKTLLARAVANRTQSAFIRVIGSELVQKYVGEGARMVRQIFELAKSKPSCILFFDEVDAFATSRKDGSDSAEGEVQRTMLELITQLDGFDSRGNIKVLMATNRPDTLDPALLRPGRLDRKIEFGLPDLDGRVNIFKIHTRSMSLDRNIRFELLARQCPNSTGADIKSVCIEAAVFAIRARKNMITEQNFLDAIQKTIKGYAKFSATPSYMQYN